MRRDDVMAVHQPGTMIYAHRMTVQVDALQKKLTEVGGIDIRELPPLFLNLSRSIDHAVASNQKPTADKMILNSFKLFAQYKDDDILFPSMMVLMLSIKSACLAGWFKQSDAEDLLASLKVLFDYSKLNGDCWKAQSSRFGASPPIESPSAETLIPAICSRYYPRLTPMSVIVALTVKPGYEVRGCDFQITSQLAQSTKLRLFVCKLESMETSVCLVTPPLLSFLLNGRGVERRMYLSAVAEAGPQLPSDITQLLRIGCNFLQIIGDCTDAYFVAIASVRSMAWSSASVKLPDYIAPLPSGDTDDELIVGSSRVSLRCPISHKRITTPVKGISCRHHQAFDYDSYMEINERRPSWRCPCCNTHVNCLELRFDQQIDKVLTEVDGKVVDVMINQDGSWAPDVAEGETDGAHNHGTVKSMGNDTVHGVLEGLPNGVIVISDDEDDDPVKQVGNGSKEPGLAGPSMNINEFDVVDRKPDIRSMHIGEVTTSLESMHIPAPMGVANRDAVPSPVLNAIYSPISDVLEQQRPVIVTNARSSLDPQGVRNAMQNHLGNASSWSGGNNLMYGSPQPIPGQSSQNRAAERSGYVPPRSTVIQALPAPSHFTNMIGRGRPTTSPSSSSPAASMTGLSIAGQQTSHLSTPGLFEGRPGQIAAQQTTQSATPGLYEVRSGQQQLQNPDIAEMLLQDFRQHSYNPNSTQTQSQLDGSHRNQRQSQRAPSQTGVVQSGHIQTQHLYGGPAGSYQAGVGLQNSNQVGQQPQYAMSTPQQSGVPARQVPDQWQRHILAQQLQQAVQASITRGSSSGTSSVHGTSYTSANGAANAGSQQVLGRQIGAHPSYPGVNNPVPNAHGAAISSCTVEGWVPPPQLTNWRPAGTPRMRGAVVLGPTTPASNPASAARGGPATGQPGPLNRARVSSNIMNMAPSTVSNASSTSTTSTWGGRANSSVGGIVPNELFNAPVPGSSSPTTLMQDISWPPTLIESSQIENAGFADTGYWIDDSLFMPGSPQDN